jgi:hypothetical protein
MSKAIKLRLATIEDAEMLLDWRNDPEKRNASHNTSEIALKGHIE